ncbi:MAG: SDR family oxidoreductase [Gemmatimonadota bacterium]
MVTGSSRGIGAEIARRLAGAGAAVAINYAGNQAAADLLVSEIQGTGGQAIAVKADVGVAADVKSMFDAAINRLGTLDILVNNAGIVLYRRIEDTTDAEFDRLLQVNVRGVFLTLREAAARLASGGRIVSLSSSVTRLMMPTYATYSATKSAVKQMSRVFAKEVGARGITVNTVAPGPTSTELFTGGKSEDTTKRLAALSAFNRIGDPADIARLVVFLVGDEAAWITGQNIGANGGMA